ncbi:OB-fold nucleic acid binding domain-containing protein [Pseudooceanicola sp. MF1-13]|uniref:OB-fold nucleic acid binding domain-containing protein n=1 Tax=Pseudooceanicola sp. MF1-13 TaxID=3379095 RepID=UPI0038927346
MPHPASAPRPPAFPDPRQPDPYPWPRPPSCLPASMLDVPPQGARVAVAGLVILRQRPGTAKGVIFLTLEDETGVVNVIVWRKLYEAFRRAVISGRMLRVTGRLQRENEVTHIIAEQIEDISHMLDELLRPGGPGDRMPRSGPAALP